MRLFNSRFVTSIAASLCAFTATAQAEFIEITVVVQTERNSRYVTITGSAIFDTSVIPDVNDNGIARLEAITGSYLYTRGITSPSSVTVPDLYTFTGASIEYAPDGVGWFDISIGGDGEGASPAISVTAGTGNAAFNIGDGSLPEDPEAYLMDTDFEGNNIYADFGGNFIMWTPEQFFDGGWVSYSVRVVEDPNQTPCSPADFNKDGVLDFFDVSVFLQLFAAGCP